MRVEHHHPVVAVVDQPGGQVTKTVHMTIGPGLAEDGTVDPAAPQVTILWAWSEHLGRPFVWFVTPNEPVSTGGARWTLDLGPGVSARLRTRAGAWCCGNPMKRFRPPGFERTARAGRT